MASRIAKRSLRRPSLEPGAPSGVAATPAFVRRIGFGFAVAVALLNCYATGDGTPPPLQDFYFPVGLQVSAGGSVLYAVNSDFDLQYNGGTLQSYDLALIRRHALDLITDPRSPNVPILDRESLERDASGCPGRSLAPLGETCAPPVRSSFYARDAAIIGALATDLLLSASPSRLATDAPRRPDEPLSCPTPASGTAAPGCLPFGTRRIDRLFSPVRGNASLTWASVERDGPESVAPSDPAAAYGPFIIQCGRDSTGRCDGAHAAGSNPDEPGNTRHLKMPGEPFGLAIGEDGTSLIVTHQNETKTSLFSTGLDRQQSEASADPGASSSSAGPEQAGARDVAPPPSLQFVLDGVPFGGIGAVAVPHDRDAVRTGLPFPRNAFLQSSRSFPELSLLRQYPDEFGGISSSLRRPFLDREAGYSVAIGASGNDSRGVAIDPTPRLLCKSKVQPADASKGRTASDVARDVLACARRPARVFMANRSPASLIIGEVGGGGPTTASGQANVPGQEAGFDTYDPDRISIQRIVPLSAGPTRVFLAPVVERDGAYALRVFVVCSDSATVFVYDPDAGQIENVIRVGLGPNAMAFDPFTFEDVAVHAQVPLDPREPGRNLRRFRFAYVASFTNSFVQLIDLDNAQADRATFERIVFTLGRPVAPKGS